MSMPELLFIVTVHVEELDTGMFRPYVSVVRQDGRRFMTQLIEIGDETLFTREASITYAVEKATEILKNQHPQAEISFKMPKDARKDTN